MGKITEIFILKMKDPEKAALARSEAKKDFLSLEGVETWRTYTTTDKSKPQLFAEVYTFPDYDTAKNVTPEFAKREKTKAFLEEIEEIVVGQYFTEIE